MQPWDEYIKAVKTGKRNAGKLEKLAVDHCLALAKKHDFDENEADRILNLFSFFRHTKGKWKGKKFNVLPHQAFFLAYLFGLKKKDGTRLINEAMINMAKKGGKSELVGAIAVALTFFDGAQSAECYTAANKTEQALYSWNSAKVICTQLAKDDSDFAADFKFYDNRLDHILIQPSTDNKFKTLPYENRTLDGVTPLLGIIDEFHEYPDMSIPDNLQSGQVLTENSLLLFCTTRGFHPWGPLAQKEEYYTNVLNGVVDDDTVLPLIYALDDDNNWENQKYWIQFAPGVDADLPSYDALATELAKKKAEGGESLARCKVKNFNIWQKSKTQYIDINDWNAGRDPIDESDLVGRLCLSAFDIGRSNDLSALVHFFPPEQDDEKFKVLARFWMPEGMMKLRSRQHRVSYRQWLDQGWLQVTPGNITDTSEIFNQILADARQFQIHNIAADKSFAIELLNQLLAKNLPAYDYPQTFRNMTGPVVKLQQMVGKQMIQHGGNPMLAWNMMNVALKKDTGGRMMMDKSDRLTGKGKENKRSKRKIDGAVSLAMCVGSWIDYQKDITEIVDEIKFL